MYLSIANHLGIHISETYIKISGALDLPVSMVVLRGAQAVGLGSHSSHLIYIYKLKITKYTYMAPYAHETQAVAPDDPPPSQWAWV